MQRDILTNGPLVAAVASIVLLVLGWVSGFWKWVSGEISAWLAHRRAVGATTTIRSPRKTMHVVAGTGANPPLMSEHNANGQISTECRTPLLITNLYEFPTIPVRAEVRLLGLARYFRRGAYEVSLSAPKYRVDEGVASKTTEGWWLTFQIFPPMPPSKSLRVNIIVYDQFGNAHRVKNVRFTSGKPDALPR